MSLFGLTGWDTHEQVSRGIWGSEERSVLEIQMGAIGIQGITVEVQGLSHSFSRVARSFQRAEYPACQTCQSLTVLAKALCRFHGSLVSREDGDSAPNSVLGLCKVFIIYVQEHSHSPRNVATPVTCTLVNTHAHTSPLQQKWPKLCEVRMSLEMISFACFKSALVCTACSSKFTLQKADSFFHILFT